MRTFFRWCTRPPRRYIAHSPLEGLQIKLGKPRTRTLTDAELLQVWRAADAQGYPHGCVVKLLVLWGLRKGEVGQSMWQWINERECTVALPAAVTKNRTEHVFPYGPLAEQILASIPRRNSTPFLFPTRYEDDRPFSGWSKFKTELNDGCAHWTLHDLRRTFATGLARLAVPPHVVERLLNHKLGSITNQTNSIVTAVAEIYNRHRYLPEMREAMITWEQHILSLLAPARGSCAASNFAPCAWSPPQILRSAQSGEVIRKRKECRKTHRHQEPNYRECSNGDEIRIGNNGESPNPVFAGR
jgi:integrase